MQNQTEITFNDIPYIPWFAGVLFFGAAVYGFMTQGFSAGTIVAGVTGLACLLLPGMLFITANRAERVLTIETLSLSMISSSKKFRFEEIAALRLHKKRAKSVDTGRKKLFSYRIEIVRKDGGIVPFRGAFNSGDAEKQRKMVQELSEFVGCTADIPSLSEYED